MNKYKFALLSIAASALLLTPAVQSASPGKANQCFACHGVNGVSVNPAFPSLAGQSKVYIIKQLKAFKSGERKSPIMAPMASGLDDEDISAVADYFSSKKAGGGEEIAKGYEGAPSGIDASAVTKAVKTTGVSLSDEDFESSKKIYFQRCAGCHGVLRKGATGKPLTTDITTKRGTEYLKTFITYGSAGGMPAWGQTNVLSEKEIETLAKYLQNEPPVPPEYGMKELKESWKIVIPVEKRNK